MRDLERLNGTESDYDSLIELIGNKRFVLVGEATHGTHEFYQERVRITKRLIENEGFSAVAVEADWPDAYRVNRYVLGLSTDKSAREALSNFRRFPAWMWRNTDVADFAIWLRTHNESVEEPQRKARFFGLDLYSLRASIDEVISYLDRVDPKAAIAAKLRYSCFESFDKAEDVGPEYGHAVTLRIATPCEEDVLAQLADLRTRANGILSSNGWLLEDEQFFAEQNARLVLNAEQYYRMMYRSNVSSWNLRDQHMAETLEAIAEHLDKKLERSKIVVWEHNSHLGDARATSLADEGELNVGQLVRERWPDDSVLVGFTTHHGWVTAASYWGGPTERKRVRPALEGSYEKRFHNQGLNRALIPMQKNSRELKGPRMERAIGVIYKPETEFGSHWFRAALSAQFDVVIHIDQTTAVTPLERTSLWDEGEAPETYPMGL